MLLQFCFDFSTFIFFFTTVGWNAVHLPGVWTATWTPRQFLQDGKPEAGNRTYMPMDIDIYGAAASYLDSKIVSGFSVNTVVEFPQPEQSHAVPYGLGWFCLEVSSCIRDMQVLSLGSHQNAGSTP